MNSEKSLQQKVHDAYEYGDIDPKSDARHAVDLIAELADEHYRALYEAKLRAAEADAERWRVSAGQTHAEWERERQERDRTNAAEVTKRQPLRKTRGKQVNIARFDLKARIAPDARGTYEALGKRYGPSAGNTFTVTHGQADGQDLWVQITYGPIKGAEKSDVRRNLDRALKDAGAELIGEADIETLSREPVEDDQTGSDSTPG